MKVVCENWRCASFDNGECGAVLENCEERLSSVQSSELLDAARDVVASAEHIDGDAHRTLVCVDALTRLAAASNNSITGG